MAGNVNDLFQLDLDQQTWTDLSKLATGTTPSPRCSHGFSSVYSTLYVFGGGLGALHDGETSYVAVVSECECNDYEIVKQTFSCRRVL